MASVRGFTPNGKRILVESVKVKPTVVEVPGTDKSLELAGSKGAQREGKVIEVGPECPVQVRTASGLRAIAEGDVVMFHTTSGVDVSANLGSQDGIYYVLHDGEILGTRGLSE